MNSAYSKVNCANKMNKYEFRKYDDNFRLLYGKEHAVLKRILPKYAKIEHVGSTAVPGLGGKGLIDIVIAVPIKKIKTTTTILEGKGYNFVTDAGSKERLFFFQRLQIKTENKKGTSSYY